VGSGVSTSTSVDVRVLLCCQLFTMLMDRPRLSSEEVKAVRYVPENMSATQMMRPRGDRPDWRSYALHVPSCPRMTLVFLRNVHLRMAVSSVPREKRDLFTFWATVTMLSFSLLSHHQQTPCFLALPLDRHTRSTAWDVVNKSLAPQVLAHVSHHH